MQHTCKSCGTRVKIPQEWILIGLDERIKCQICGKRVNLKIKEYVNKKQSLPDKDEKTQGGTVILSQKKQVKTSYRLIISDKNTNNTLIIIHIDSHKTYIVGRNKEKIARLNPEAEAITIPAEFDPAVSRVHFEIKIKTTNASSKISIKDLNSLHKTHLLRDGASQILEAHEQVLVNVMDKIRIGQNTLISFSNV